MEDWERVEPRLASESAEVLPGRPMWLGIHWGSLQPSSLGGAYSVPQFPSWWGGARCTLTKNPSPLSACGFEFWPFRPQESSQKDMASVSNQNCCKGFRFTEKVEEHWTTATLSATMHSITDRQTDRQTDKIMMPIANHTVHQKFSLMQCTT